SVAPFLPTASNPPAGFIDSTAPFSLFDMPSIAVDTSQGAHRGNVYVAFHDRDRTLDPRDIKLARSTDRGASFEPPIRVNDDPPGADQFFPRVAVDPGDGQVSVVYYDRRGDPANELTNVFLTQSNDGGRTLVAGTPVTDTASSFSVPSDAFPNFGDYIAVTSDGQAIYAGWTDGRRGSPDVFFSKIAKDSSPYVFLSSSS